MLVTELNVKGSSIIDDRILKRCQEKINGFVDDLSEIDHSYMPIQDLISFLRKNIKTLPFFTEYSNKFIIQMKLNSGTRTAHNYECALKNFHKYIGKDKIHFHETRSNILQEWINSLFNTNRTRRLYPTCLSTIFKAACKEYNDYGRTKILIKIIHLNMLIYLTIKEINQ